MEDFYINNTSRDNSYNYSNINFSYDNDTNGTDYNNDLSGFYTLLSILNVMDWIVIGSGLPLTLVAIAVVYSLIKKDHIAPVYIINLLISDLIQLCCLTAIKAGHFNFIIVDFYLYGLMASVGFMVCISLERYLVITQPLWYRFRRNIKTSVVVSVLVLILPLVYVLLSYFRFDLDLICAIYLLLPFPLFIFFLVGTIKALSAARSVPADEKQRIVAILVLVLLIYTLLFLPNIICLLVEEVRYNQTLSTTSYIFLRISPLVDLTLYVFIRKGVVDKLLTSLCCC